MSRKKPSPAHLPPENAMPPDDATAPDDFPFGAEAPADPGPDPFDVSRLLLPDADGIDAALGVREVLVSVPCRKPTKEEFFRVRPGADFSCRGGVIELKDDGETYWPDPALWPLMADEPTFGYRRLLVCVNSRRAPFLWALKLPGADGKSPPWIATPMEAARIAETQWVKLYWDQGRKQHAVKVAGGLTLAPAWPELTLKELLKLAFRDKVIASADHPVLKQLRGES